jgi:hypothetical protein
VCVGNPKLAFHERRAIQSRFVRQLPHKQPAHWKHAVVLLGEGFAQLERYFALPASRSSAHPEAFKPIITLTTISHFAAAFCMADSERGFL